MKGGGVFEAGRYRDRDGSGADVRRLSLAKDGYATGGYSAMAALSGRRRDGTHEQPGRNRDLYWLCGLESLWRIALKKNKMYLLGMIFLNT